MICPSARKTRRCPATCSRRCSSGARWRAQPGEWSAAIASATPPDPRPGAPAPAIRSRIRCRSRFAAPTCRSRTGIPAPLCRALRRLRASRFQCGPPGAICGKCPPVRPSDQPGWPRWNTLSAHPPADTWGPRCNNDVRAPFGRKFRAPVLRTQPNAPGHRPKARP